MIKRVYFVIFILVGSKMGLKNEEPLMRTQIKRVLLFLVVNCSAMLTLRQEDENPTNKHIHFVLPCITHTHTHTDGAPWSALTAVAAMPPETPRRPRRVCLQGFAKSTEEWGRARRRARRSARRSAGQRRSGRRSQRRRRGEEVHHHLDLFRGR